MTNKTNCQEVGHGAGWGGGHGVDRRGVENGSMIEG